MNGFVDITDGAGILAQGATDMTANEDMVPLKKCVRRPEVSRVQRPQNGTREIFSTWHSCRPFYSFSQPQKTAPPTTMTTDAHSGDNVIADIVNGSVVKSYVTPMLDQNISFIDHDASATYYYNQDERQSVRNLTDTTGSIAATYDYSAYGDRIDSLTLHTTPDTRQNRYQYTGREASDISGLHYFRYRMYGSGIGGFMSRDPAGYVDGSSLYNGYFGSMLGIDPLGLEQVSVSVNISGGTTIREFREATAIAPQFPRGGRFPIYNDDGLPVRPGESYTYWKLLWKRHLSKWRIGIKLYANVIKNEPGWLKLGNANSSATSLEGLKGLTKNDIAGWGKETNWWKNRDGNPRIAQDATTSLDMDRNVDIGNTGKRRCVQCARMTGTISFTSIPDPIFKKYLDEGIQAGVGAIPYVGGLISDWVPEWTSGMLEKNHDLGIALTVCADGRSATVVHGMPSGTTSRTQAPGFHNQPLDKAKGILTHENGVFVNGNFQRNGGTYYSEN